MITEVIEKQVRVEVPSSERWPREVFRAVVRGDRVVENTHLPQEPNKEEIKTYILFLNEVLEAMG